MNDKYSAYNLDDFLNDPSFIQWAYEEDPDSTDFWPVWLKDHPEKSDVVGEAREIIQSIRFKSHDTTRQEERIWESIQENLSKEEKSDKKPLFIRLLPYAAVAAGLALILYFQLGPDNITISSNPEQQISYVLPDDSKVELNASSSITFNPGEFPEHRKVQLNGEAYFTVEKGNTFEVKTPLGYVEVLGTKFNVRSREDVFEVRVYSGKVRVSNAGGSESVILLPNQSATMDETSALIKSEFENEAQASWLDGYFIFDTAKLEEVFKHLETRFNVEFEANDEILAKEYNGSIHNSNLDSALQTLEYTMKLESDRLGNKIIIRSAE